MTKHEFQQELEEALAVIRPQIVNAERTVVTVFSTWQQVCQLSRRMCNPGTGTPNSLEIDKAVCSGCAVIATHSVGGRWWEGTPTGFVPDENTSFGYKPGWHSFTEDSCYRLVWESATSSAIVTACKGGPIGWTLKYEGPPRGMPPSGGSPESMYFDKVLELGCEPDLQSCASQYAYEEVQKHL